MTKKKAMLKVTLEALHDLLELPEDVRLTHVFREPENYSNDTFQVKLYGDGLPEGCPTQEFDVIPIISLDAITRPMTETS